MMTFSEYLKQYLDARDRLAYLANRVGVMAETARSMAIADLAEAATRMDELMPCGGVK